MMNMLMSLIKSFKKCMEITKCHTMYHNIYDFYLSIYLTKAGGGRNLGGSPSKAVLGNSM